MSGMSKAITTLLLAVSVAACSTSGESKGDGVDARRAAEANAELGVRYMLQGNYQVALDKLTKALKYDDESVHAHHYIAELYRRLEEYDKAEEHFEEAIDNLEGDDSSLYNNYGAFLCSRGRVEDAEEQFEHVLENPVYKDKAGVYENLGYCYQQVPDMAKAEDYFRKALKFDSKRPQSLLAMANLSFEQKNYLSTRGYLQRYLEVGRHTPASLWLGIRVERLLGDNNAVDSYGLLLKADFPNSKEAHLYEESGGR